jgi:hypothetical protein
MTRPEERPDLFYVPLAEAEAGIVARLRRDLAAVHPNVTFPPPAPRCEAQTGWRRADFQLDTPAYCRQWVGLRSFVAVDGSTHRYCTAEGHEARVRAQVRRMIG